MKINVAVPVFPFFDFVRLISGSVSSETPLMNSIDVVIKREIL